MKRWIIALTLLVMAGAAVLVFLFFRQFNAPVKGNLFGRADIARQVLSEQIRLPPGFTWTHYAEPIENARMMVFTPLGHLIVSSPRLGQVIALAPDSDRDGRSDGSRIIAQNLDRPHGLALRQGWLYVADMKGVMRYPFDESEALVTGDGERVIEDLPGNKGHWTRTIGFGPDGLLYLTIGSSCNACVENDPRRAAMLRFDPETWHGEIHARGLRNTVGFAWAPWNSALYGTDNGRDWLGDDFPPCELNRIAKDGFYGWPFANGDQVPDPDHGEGRQAEIAQSIPPVHGFRPHTAPLGLAFLAGARLPPGYERSALVALHGSWNHSVKVGYKVVSLHWQQDGSITEHDFMTGLEQDGQVYGRPVDIAVGADGAIYVSDDYTGHIYRIAYGEDVRLAAASIGEDPE